MLCQTGISYSFDLGSVLWFLAHLSFLSEMGVGPTGHRCQAPGAGQEAVSGCCLHTAGGR